ncbi:GNAT family N-acetyltransferase [Candidatus Deianiraea vastatrix]|uniref:N-acetyltransferase n=1 Tax=Candidatus Deianiraea vastatrix TaxID=2163644 RepID=A0A5B8XDT4_9RICK|nr:GNAT family N-acetyltransferase [Candidatus Deianiraea vastatrix]QED23166.1 Putative N-acetyltransferase [Candidatus Deianiraea vastatrix]
MQIITANNKHCKQIKELLKQLEYSMSDDQILERLNIYNDDFHRCFLAVINDEIAGLVALSIRELFIIQTRKAFIEGLVVDEKFRGQKIGEKLLKYSENYAKNQGCSIVELTSGKRREKNGALRFYERLGFSDGQKNYLRKNV